MNHIPAIHIQRLFGLILGLKVTSSFFGWALNSPWILGFGIPLALMVSYIVIGSYRRGSDVTDEKFADTCYYLGFIFTITSIIFCLLDLPNIGTKIQEIAVRFGAAMVSTVLGLSVRVYLVSFKRDAADAVKEAEEAILDAARKFAEQLTIAVERLQDFESQVDSAAKSSVERVNLQVENLSKNHAERLAGFFTELTARNQEAFTHALAEVKTASHRLSDSVDGYSIGMQSNLSNIEIKVGAFTDAVTDRLRTTSFPDDYFAKHLETPLTQLRDSATDLAGGVKQVNNEVAESATILSKALTKLRQKAGAAEDSLDTVLRLSTQQQAILDTANGQVSALGQLTAALANLDIALSSTLGGLVAHTAVSAELRTSVSSIVCEGAEARKSLEESLAAIAGKLESNATATSDVASKLDTNAILAAKMSSTFTARLDANSTAAIEAATKIAEKLDESVRATESLMSGLSTASTVTTGMVGRLDSLATREENALAARDQLNEQVTVANSQTREVIEQLKEVIRKFLALDSSLGAQGIDLKLIVHQIKNLEPVPTPFPNVLSRGPVALENADGHVDFVANRAL